MLRRGEHDHGGFELFFHHQGDSGRQHRRTDSDCDECLQAIKNEPEEVRGIELGVRSAHEVGIDLGVGKGIHLIR